jgi:hypothetical protein
VCVERPVEDSRGVVHRRCCCSRRIRCRRAEGSGDLGDVGLAGKRRREACCVEGCECGRIFGRIMFVQLGEGTLEAEPSVDLGLQELERRHRLAVRRAVVDGLPCGGPVECLHGLVAARDDVAPSGDTWRVDPSQVRVVGRLLRDRDAPIRIGRRTGAMADRDTVPRAGFTHHAAGPEKTECDHGDKCRRQARRAEALVVPSHGVQLSARIGSA